MTNNNKFRVWWIPQVPMAPFFYAVDSLSEAYHMIDMLAKYDLFQYENNVKPDYANAGNIQMWDEEDQDWFDLEDFEIENMLEEEKV